MRRRWQQGDVLEDRYRLEEPIGRGAMGEVWRAEHTRLGSPVAVKLLHEDVEQASEVEERFLREARACAALRGPHIVEVLDVGVVEGTAFLAMELLVGESLGARLAARGHLSPGEVTQLLAQVVRAVGRSHRHGIVHRDLKPANIFLTSDEDTGDEIVKVLDFGIAKMLEGTKLATSSLTATGATLGTGVYMSPEQARGTREIDHRSDLWSLAILTYQCLVGEVPLTRPSFADLVVALHADPMPVPSAARPGLPAGFDAWFAKGTRRSPDDRFQSAAELAKSLADALAT